MWHSNTWECIAWHLRTAWRLVGWDHIGTCRTEWKFCPQPKMCQLWNLIFLYRHKPALHKYTWTVGDLQRGPWAPFGWVANETVRNWMTHSFESGWSESSTDTELTLHRRSPLDNVTKTSSGPHLPPTAISLWLINCPLSWTKPHVCLTKHPWGWWEKRWY